jgi:endonuclease/exonuclease/phosphatase family metal-dependent hydrolase
MYRESRLVSILTAGWVAGCVLCVPKTCSADTIRLTTWNIETLTTGKLVFADRQPRTAADIDLLRDFAKSVPADVVALQEIASPAAAAQIFPISEWKICISGQFFEDYKVSGPEGKADCFENQPLPDTPSQEAFAKQYVGFAIRKSLVTNVTLSDIPSLGVMHTDPLDGTQRPVRWGLVAEFTQGEQQLKLLNIHLKSRCPFGHPNMKDRSKTPDCETLFKQFQPLLQVVRSLKPPFALVGDFNRKLDDKDELWRRLTGQKTKKVSDDIELSRAPTGAYQECIGSRVATGIDFFVLSPAATATEFQIHRPSKAFGATGEAIRQSFGDHCPLSIVLTY